jgi:hypothetical protein
MADSIHGGNDKSQNKMTPVQAVCSLILIEKFRGHDTKFLFSPFLLRTFRSYLFISELFSQQHHQTYRCGDHSQDVCVSPVLNLDETLSSILTVYPTGPCSQAVRTPGKARDAKGPKGANTEEILLDLGYSDQTIQAFLKADVIE